MRERLARLALETPLATPGVVAPNMGTGGLYVTSTNDGRLTGVRVIAAPEGAWPVELGVTGGLVLLHPLAETVRERVRGAFVRAGLAPRIDGVDVAILDVEEHGAPAVAGSAMI